MNEKIEIFETQITAIGDDAYSFTIKGTLTDKKSRENGVPPALSVVLVNAFEAPMTVDQARDFAGISQTAS